MTRDPLSSALDTQTLRVARVRVLPITLDIQQSLRFTQGTVRAFQRIVVELTSEDGFVGYGECRGDSLIYAALTGMADSVVGMDPFQLEQLRWRIAPQGLVELFSGTIAVQCYSAFEVACLDLIGKTIGRSVSDLLGGQLRQHIDTAGYLYYSGASADSEAQNDIVALAHNIVDKYGFTTLKYKCGVFEPDVEIATLRRLRSEFPGHRLRIDPNGSWGISTSVRFLHVARELDVEFIEDPAPTLTKNSRIRELNPGVALASNQAVASLDTIALNQEIGAIDIALIDLNWYGGLRAGVLAGRMSELLGRDVGIHSSHETGISQAAQLHMAACIANLPYAADSHHFYLDEDVVDGDQFSPVEGKMVVPVGPGLGIDVDIDNLERLHARWRKIGFMSWDNDDKEPVVLPRW